MHKISRQILFVLCSVCLFVSAQAQTLYDVLYLKNGTKVIGTIVEQQPGSTIKIKDLKGNIYLFSPSEVDRMAREGAVEEKPQKIFDYAAVRNAKWYVAFYAGAAAASMEMLDINYSWNGLEITNPSEYWQVMGSVQAAAGYRINPQATVGLNIGGLVNSRVRYLPIMVEGTYAFLRKKVSPYVNAAAGYSIGFRDPQVKYPLPGGGAAAMRLGVKVYANSDLSILVDLGYRTQQRFLYFPEKWFHGLEFRTGFMF